MRRGKSSRSKTPSRQALCFASLRLCASLLFVVAASVSAAPRPPLWSIQPLSSPAAPCTPFDALAHTPIDRFIFAKLAEKGLRPSPPADKLALIRRVTFDLTGLPPTPEEVDAFVNDAAANAYERVVDRLLASPAYGERWARHWLDVVRFGESNGYEQNHLRPNAWPYRDYVIRAFNDDKPYTDFITEQLAGDALGGDASLGTGFLVAGIHDTVGNQTEEGTRQQRSNDLDDIVSTVGATFLGLTVGCAKCHDHKFDPIPQRDYYRMTAVFAGVRHGERALSESIPTAAAAERTDAASLARDIRALQIRFAEIDHKARAAVLRSQGLDPVPRPAVTGRLNLDDFTPTRAKFIRFYVIETKDGTEPCLDELELYGVSGENLALASRGAKATASSLLPGYAIHQVAHLNDGRYGNEWSWISNERGHGWAQIELPAPAMISRVVWSRDSAGERPQYVDRLATAYRIDVSLDGKEWRTVSTGVDRAQALEAIPQPTLLAALTAEQRERRAALARELEQLRGRLNPAASASAKAYIGNFTAPEPTFVLTRGDVMRRADEVTPGGLSQIPDLWSELQLPSQLTESPRRLALARWLCDERNPLTARVMVNRLWQHHFGRGLVATPSDFGNNGARPSHPELLDWLATDFMRNRWTMKRMHRMMVLSQVYRQSSRIENRGLRIATAQGRLDPQLRDPDNRLLWRAPLRRLESEAVRDAILATSGSLNRAMGGPGVSLFKYRVVNVAIYEPLDEHAPATWRRAVYTTQVRAIREDLMACFDAPECANRAPRRDVTTTPLQALTLLNGNFVVQQSERFADRVRHEAGAALAAQIERAFRLALGRAPTNEEMKFARSLVAQAGLSALCRGLLNANEFLYY